MPQYKKQLHTVVLIVNPRVMTIIRPIRGSKDFFCCWGGRFGGFKVEFRTQWGFAYGVVKLAGAQWGVLFGKSPGRAGHRNSCEIAMYMR
jgi:hypothetical protein